MIFRSTIYSELMRKILFLFVLRTIGFIKGHRAQWANGALIVAGGDKDGGRQMSSETCTVDEKGEFTCVKVSPSLTNSYWVVCTLQYQ